MFLKSPPPLPPWVGRCFISSVLLKTPPGMEKSNSIPFCSKTLVITVIVVAVHGGAGWILDPGPPSQGLGPSTAPGALQTCTHRSPSTCWLARETRRKTSETEGFFFCPLTEMGMPAKSDSQIRDYRILRPSSQVTWLQKRAFS